MSWARGIREDGKEAGYDIPDVCGIDECGVSIDRGISYTCGGTLYFHEGYGCGEWFCSAHLYLGDQLAFLCPTCSQAEDDLGQWIEDEDE